MGVAGGPPKTEVRGDTDTDTDSDMDMDVPKIFKNYSMSPDSSRTCRHNIATHFVYILKKQK